MTIHIYFNGFEIFISLGQNPKVTLVKIKLTEEKQVKLKNQ